ncbi:MAG: hypothetical protein K8R60_21390 [Burkholderiales bacterium]|nr:hypothetical protein [Burkholderiales bacterium]
MSGNVLAPLFPQHALAALSREEWDLLFSSVRIRLEQTVAVFPPEAEPAETMIRVRADVQECVEALRKLQILMAPPRAGWRATD